MLLEVCGESPDVEIRVTAAQALGKIGPGAREAVPALELVLRDADAAIASWKPTEIELSIKIMHEAENSDLRDSMSNIQYRIKKEEIFRAAVAEALKEIRGAEAGK